MFYKLEYLTPAAVIHEIEQYTSHNTSTDASLQKYVSDISDTLAKEDPELTICRGFLYAPTIPDITKTVIGKGGCYFHMTTTKQDIYFIWHDRTSNKFLFWGPKFNLIKAMNIIKHRIQIADAAYNDSMRVDE